MIYLRLYDDAQATVLDLLSGNLRLRGSDWPAPHTSLQQKAIALPFGYQAQSQGYSPVIESIPLVAVGCAEDIRDALAVLEVLLARAAAHHDDPVVESPIWLECRSESEAARRTLVTGGSWAPVPRYGAAPDLKGGKLQLTLALTHAPMWENATTEQDDTCSLSSVGGAWLWTDTTGRVPARLSRVQFSDDITGFYGGAGNPLTTIWAGWRPEYKGLSNFNPVWSCASTASGGGMSTFDDGGETTDVVDGTYYGSVSAHTIFADATLKQRLHITVEGVNGSTTDAKHFAGRYVVLCRTWVDAGEALLQMEYGYHNTTNRTRCEPVKVDTTAPRFKELGTIQIPTPGLWPESATVDYDAQCARFSIVLYSQQVSASAIDQNCLVLIPCDFYVKLETADVYAGADPDRLTSVSCLPSDHFLAYTEQVTPAWVISSASPSPLQWYLPTGDSMLVLAAEQDAGQDVDDLLCVDVQWLPRWLSYRD